MTLLDDTNKYITMVSACTFYWDSNESGDGNATVCTGFKFAYMKNFGSLCFGSLIMTLIKILVFIVETLAKSNSDSTNPAARCIACIALCCVRCLERLVEYLNKTAYAYMAISGTSFCKSAWSGFLLNLKYLAKFYFAISIAGMFVFMGVFSVAVANIAIGYALTHYVTKEIDDVNSLFGPFVAIVVLSFFIPIVCLGLFDEAVIATMQCYGVDTDLHGEPKFGPKSYHEKLRAIKER